MLGGVNSTSESIRQRPGSLVRTNLSFENGGLLGALIPILLEMLMKFRNTPDSPYWFNLP